MEAKQPTYFIVGAGVAGLSCARLLKKKKPKSKVIVFDACDNVGGRCYSFDDKDFGQKLDNATHVIIGANKEAASFIADDEWEKSLYFFDIQNKKVIPNNKKMWPYLMKAACNMPLNTADGKICKEIAKATFPWTTNKLKIYFSKQNLSQKMINYLLNFADEIYLKHRLLKIETQFGNAAQLVFDKQTFDIGAQDKIILALDNRGFCRLMGTEALPHNNIINIFYKTSQKIHLPQNANFCGVLNGNCDWIFVNDNIVAITISAANHVVKPLPELARQLWKELDIIRGVNSAFLPPFRVVKHNHATIAQDEATNQLRPCSALTQYPNVFIAGDWTMKNMPCCIETAILSAKRAIKYVLR